MTAQVRGVEETDDTLHRFRSVDLWEVRGPLQTCNDHACPMNPVLVPLLIAAQAVIKLRGDKPRMTAAIAFSRNPYNPSLRSRDPC